MSQQRRWDADTKATALRIYAERGGPAASEATGVPVATIRSWAHRAATEAAAVVATVTGRTIAQAGTDWPTRRAELLAELPDAIAETLVAYRRKVADGSGRDARDFSVALAVLVDKAQLIAGHATSRSESLRLTASVSAIDVELESLAAELDLDAIDGAPPGVLDVTSREDDA